MVQCKTLHMERESMETRFHMGSQYLHQLNLPCRVGLESGLPDAFVDGLIELRVAFLVVPDAGEQVGQQGQEQGLVLVNLQHIRHS